MNVAKQKNNHDVAVIGAGIVGLAVARKFAASGKKVIVFEKNPSCGTETSSRGSGVIHSGLYYDKKTQPLKAALCVEGNPLLYEYAKTKKIPHRQLGKIIVATNEEEVEKLRKLQINGHLNGVNNLQELTTEDVRKMEPHVMCIKGLYSPSTGIIDPHGLIKALVQDIEQMGGLIKNQTPMIAGKVTEHGIQLTYNTPNTETALFGTVINSAGLQAIAVAQSIEGLDKKHIPENNYSKGYYYRFKKLAPFRHLIYPLPVERGLGIHATQDIENNTRFGPNNEQVTDIDYSFMEAEDQSRKKYL